MGAEVAYLHADHLGSPVAATDETGAILWAEHFTPYGESIPGPAANPDDEGFTGHIQDTDTGLTYMQARYYDPVIGRFHSNDPVGFAQGGVAYFNRYAYTANDPVNAIDPTGMDIEEIISDDQTFDQAKAAAKAAGAQGKAGAELTTDVNSSLVALSSHANGQLGFNGQGSITANAGVKTTGVSGLIANMTGAEDGRFSTIRPRTQGGRACNVCAGPQGEPGLSTSGDGGGVFGSNIVVQTVLEQGSFTDDATFGSPDFDAFVGNVTAANQSIANNTGRVMAVTVSNRNARPTSVRARSFVITPDN